MIKCRKKRIHEAIVFDGVKNVKEIIELVKTKNPVDTDFTFSFEDDLMVIRKDGEVIIKESDVLIDGEVIMSKEDFDTNYEKVVTRKRKEKVLD